MDDFRLFFECDAFFFGLPERLDMGMYNDVASVTIP